jgi:hypothetical protein
MPINQNSLANGIMMKFKSMINALKITLLSKQLNQESLFHIQLVDIKERSSERHNVQL